jgi:hypothetical protein
VQEREARRTSEESDTGHQASLYMEPPEGGIVDLSEGSTAAGVEVESLRREGSGSVRRLFDVVASRTSENGGTSRRNEDGGGKGEMGRLTWSKDGLAEGASLSMEVILSKREKGRSKKRREEEEKEERRTSTFAIFDKQAGGR